MTIVTRQMHFRNNRNPSTYVGARKVLAISLILKERDSEPHQFLNFDRREKCGMKALAMIAKDVPHALDGDCRDPLSEIVLFSLRYFNGSVKSARSGVTDRLRSTCSAASPGTPSRIHRSHFHIRGN